MEQEHGSEAQKKHPKEVTIVKINGDGSILANMPFERMPIRPRKKSQLTEEQREQKWNPMLSIRK
ncbi:MAG: hypothetical protein GX248_05405 [Peptococcaceae bacterium]|jgi:hypothetical protein|nr:hypothetical protein [Peptococcaceae bacterium]